MKFEIIDRPEKNRHKNSDDLEYDHHLESSLMDTLESGRAIRVPLGIFHSSPAKGRLWKKGYQVRHRVLPDREHVAAWIEEEKEHEDGLKEEEEEDFPSELQPSLL